MLRWWYDGHCGVGLDSLNWKTIELKNRQTLFAHSDWHLRYISLVKRPFITGVNRNHRIRLFEEEGKLNIMLCILVDDEKCI